MARLLSVNVGLPRDIEWKGRTVHTGIWKDPVRGRCRVGRLNLDGDGQGDLGGHGGEQRAVFVYQIESYRHWQAAAEADRLRPRTVRREFHDRRIARRCGLHRRPLSDRQRAVRGHPTSRYLLSRRHSDERAADAGIADIQRTAGILFPRAGGRRGGRRRRNREGGRGERANDRRGDQRAALFAQSCARSIGARLADRGAFARMARIVRGVAAEPIDRRGERQRGARAGSRRASGGTRISAARGDGDRSGVRGRPLADDAKSGRSAAANGSARPVRGLASSTRPPAARRCFAATRSRVRSRPSAIGSA